MKTKFANLDSVSRNWHLVDATDLVLGRMASKVASILRGKHKPMYSPHVDTGDFVVVINANKVKVSGDKNRDKIYYRHSGFIGGGTATAFHEQQERFPERVIELAVKGMLPKTRLGRKMFNKLKVYAEGSHPHVAQNPLNLSL
ncbi:MAG TPA: 50S ribosomal protein L13 [Myxococcota bacterium]|nr:50S ribosomal protein L13 [Myxococcota bacterium]